MKSRQGQNSIDLEFAGGGPKEKAVRDAWQTYLDHLGSKTLEGQGWADKRVDLQVELLYAMGRCLKYDFNKTQIKNAAYSPVMHGRVESEQEQLRTMVLELLEGKRSLRVTEIPKQTQERSSSQQ